MKERTGGLFNFSNWWLIRKGGLSRTLGIVKFFTTRTRTNLRKYGTLLIN